MSLIRISPVGLTVGPAPGRPVLIFKDKTEKFILPVWLDHVDAGLVMADSSNKTRASGVHHAVLEIFKSYDIQTEKVVFDDIVGHHQYVTVHLRQGKGKSIRKVKLRAAEVMSLCLKAGVQFYVSPEVIEQSREIDLTLNTHPGILQGFGAVDIPDFLKN